MVRVTDYHRSYVTKTPSLFLPHSPSSEGKGSLFKKHNIEGRFFFLLDFDFPSRVWIREKCFVHLDNSYWKVLPEINKLSGANDLFLIYSDDIWFKCDEYMLV